MLQNKRINLVDTSEINPLIQQWLKQRQSVLVHYSELCTIKNSETENLQQFCQTLMDYISTGHFKMFEKLAEVYHASQPQFQPLDAELLNKILLTTDIALDFNDKYTDPKELDALFSDLSPLGEALANRMDWEDEYIKFCLQHSV